MAIEVQRSGATEQGDAIQFGVDYRVVGDESQVLTPKTAMEAAVAQATTDYGVEPIGVNFQRVSFREIICPITVSTIQYYNYLTHIESGGGGGPGPGPFVPKITSERVGRILPPQPIELEKAYETLQKQPNGPTAFAPDTLVLEQRAKEVRSRVPIYPPQENYSERFNVPPTLATADLFLKISRLAHRLNDAPILLGGEEWPAQTVMLLAGAMQSTASGAAVLDLSFAIGEEYSVDWTRTGTAGTEELTMEGVKPFSRLTEHRDRTPASETAAATVVVYGLWEHRVYRTADYSTVFDVPEP